MKAFEKVDWDNIKDFDLVVGDYIDMPDGTQHYIEMDMLHWSLLAFMIKQGHSPTKIARDCQLTMQRHPDDPTDFDELFRHCLYAYSREWIRLRTGK